ncbi:MAG TPA: toll/interleukin-1 receptor domain-containing protein [Thermoanaerobaculia bacterium]|nr:toll/interleukin-1 receptor domain-containing protein [Thermoanaerobaculia bacterium]
MQHPEEPKVFICYSHEDQRWLDELLLHLKPLEDRNLLDCWSDQEIAPGRQWQQEIERALRSARVAVLLVSPDFLASSFIAEKELRPLLEAAGQGDLTILWLPVSASNYKHTELVEYQAAHPPERPLDRLRKSDRQQAFVEISDRILKALGPSVGDPNSRNGGGPGRTAGVRRDEEPRTEAPKPASPATLPSPAEPAPEEDFPILRRSRSLWAGLAVLLGITLFVCPLPLPLPDAPISGQLPFLSWRQLGWAGIGVLLILCCLIRSTREGFVYKVADQLTDTVLLVTSSLLDLATHWRHQSRRWAVGLVVAAMLVVPVAVYAVGELVTHLERMDNISELRSALLRFVSYGRLQGGNEAELSVLTKAYGTGDSFPPEALSTPRLRATYKTVADLYALQNNFQQADYELRRRQVRDFWKDFIREPCCDPAAGGVELEDDLTHLALRARARSFLLSQDAITPEVAADIETAEAEYARLQELASRLGEGTPRRRLLGVAFNGMGTLKVLRYRLLMGEEGTERDRALLLSEAYALYQDSSSAKAGGDDSDDARARTANNQVDLEMYLLKESLAESEHFRDALNHRLLVKYAEFRDDPASLTSWVDRHAAGLEERARFSRNPIFFLTVAQINALAAERLLQQRPQCLQRTEDLTEGPVPACSEVDTTLRNGFFNLSTAIYLGHPATGIAREPRKNLVCVYFSNPVTRKDAEFLFARFRAHPNLEPCT